MRHVGDELVAMLADPPDRRSLGRSGEVVEAVLADDRGFDAVFAAMREEDPVVRMRAADAVEKITRTRPELLEPYVDALLTTATVEQAEVRWHIAALLTRVPLSDVQQATAVRVLHGYLQDGSSIVRTCAMQALAGLAEQDADLAREVVPLLELLTATGTPAMRARGRRLLARFGGR